MAEKRLKNKSIRNYFLFSRLTSRHTHTRPPTARLLRPSICFSNQTKMSNVPFWATCTPRNKNYNIIIVVISAKHTPFARTVFNARFAFPSFVCCRLQSISIVRHGADVVEFPMNAAAAESEMLQRKCTNAAAEHKSAQMCSRVNARHTEINAAIAQAK